MSTLRTILKDNWEWRESIFQLAVFDIKKQARGTVLGWAWLLIRPLILIFVFWFALEIGLRADKDMPGDFPYFIWLISGLIPWYFMMEMLNSGSDVLHRYGYLVNRVKFPMSAISTVFTLSRLLINLMLMVILLLIYTIYGMPWDIYMLQIPLIIILMFLFWNTASIFTSQLSGMTRDFAQFMRAIRQPFFWMSGIIYSVDRLIAAGLDWVGTVLLFNPVTFFATALRKATCHKQWFWEDPAFFGAFLFVFALTAVLAILAYRRFNEEIPDVL